jgi:cytoskeleton protein RodZ
MAAMADGQAVSVGARLRQRREERGVSVRELATLTKISRSALEAIERDDVTHLPGGIFGRSFVRNYAHELGFDAAQIQKDFFAQFPADEPEALDLAPRGRAVRPGARAVVHFGLASVPLLVAVVWFAFSPAPLSGDRIAAARTDMQPPIAVSPAANVVAARTGEAVPAIHQSGVLNLVLTTRSACWVSAAADGRPIVERLLSPGEVLELKAERVVAMKLGDAGAVAMLINGEVARSLGGPGQVITARIDQTNFRDFLAIP